jgi:hypothetical protein
MTKPEPVDPGQALERVAAACHDPLIDIWEELDERMGAAVLAAVADVRDRHAALVVECGLDSGAPGDLIERRASLIHYRHGLTADVLPALVATLEHHKPAMLAAGIFANRFAEAVDLSRGLPDAEPVLWGGGALDARPDDPLRRRARKRLARWVSVARKPERHRPLPFRALALRHLEHHVLPLYDRAASDSVRIWAEWAGRLEHAFATWSETALPTLMEADAAVVPDDDPEPSDDGGDEDAAWTLLRIAAEALGEALGALADGPPDVELRSRTEGLMDRVHVALDSDLRSAGSFVLQPEIPIIGAHPLSELDRTRATLSGWDEQVASRLSLYRSLLALTVGGAAVRERLGRRMDDVAVKPLEVLDTCLEELSQLAAEARRTRPAASDTGQFEKLRNRGDAVVARALDAFPDTERVSTELESIVGDTVDALQGIVRQAPERFVLHRLDSRTPTTMRVAETRRISFQELARQSLDAVRIERIRAATLGLGRALVPIEASVDELPGVLQFAFDACRDELEAEPPENDATSRAALLAAEALERAAGVLGQTPDRVRAAVVAVDSRVASELAQGGLSLLDRVGAGRVQSQFLRAQSRFGDALLRLEARFGPAVDRLGRRSRLLRIRTARFGGRVSRRAMALLGKDGGAPAAQSARTVRAFARGDSGPGHVPIVYQRLFSLAPVTDATFLTGRAVELADVQQRWRRWGDEDEVPVIVRGYPGSGVTSFIRVVADTLGDDGATVVRHEVDDRILSEAGLVALLATLLDLEPTESLGEFARTVLRIPKGNGLPDVVALDGLEHLYLRVPGGTDVLERFLTFMSETEPRIFWLGGVSQPAWKLIAKAEPTAVSQVEAFELRALPVERLRETILQRHRRSGLRLRFAEPREGRALLKRRLRRLRGTDAHQRLLEDDFFEQLHRVSLGNLKLALFHWMLAADFEQTEGEVVMQPLQKPDFGVLDALDPTHNFTLKALLEHRTLTLEEHRSVFRVSRQESYQIFESLQSRRLIERIDTVASEADDSEINATSRYRIRPLLVGAITGHLKTLNIVH